MDECSIEGCDGSGVYGYAIERKAFAALLFVHVFTQLKIHFFY